jgi:hypothetical protein
VYIIRHQTVGVVFKCRMSKCTVHSCTHMFKCRMSKYTPVLICSNVVCRSTQYTPVLINACESYCILLGTVCAFGTLYSYLFRWLLNSKIFSSLFLSLRAYFRESQLISCLLLCPLNVLFPCCFMYAYFTTPIGACDTHIVKFTLYSPCILVTN